MLQSVTFISARSSISNLTIPVALSTALTDKFQIRGIDGLGPVKATISTTPFGVGDGETFNSSSVGNRNLVIKIGYNPDWDENTIESLRSELYRYFMPKSWVKCRFTTSHLPVCEIDGYVESMEPNIFSKDPEVTISIICPQSTFVGTTLLVASGVVTNGDDISSGGGAPPGGHVDDDFTSRHTTDLIEIDNPGNVSSGLESLEVHSSSGVSDSLDTAKLEIIVVQETTQYVPSDPDNLPSSLVVEPLHIDSGHFFRMSSVPGRKFVRLYTAVGDTYVNILASVVSPGRYIFWPLLEGGKNYIVVRGVGTVGQNWNLSYYPRFGGL